jgi:hypothetical protein
VTVEALEGGVSKYLKAFESTAFEIPVDQDPQAVQVLFDGIVLDCLFNYEAIAGNNKGVHLVPCVYFNGEGTRLNLFPNTDSVGGDQSGTYFASSDRGIFSASDTTTFTISGNLALVQQNVETGVYTLSIRTSTNHSLQLYSSTISQKNTEVAFSGTFTVNGNENVFLEANWTGKNNIYYRSQQSRSTIRTFGVTLPKLGFKVAFKNKYQSTICYGLYPYRLFEKIFEQMSNGKYFVKSAWLKSKKDVVFFSGDSLRRLTGSVIKISLADFFKSMNFFSCGLGVEMEKLMIEELKYFFNTSKIIGIGQVSEAEVTPAEDIFFNTIKSGCDKQDYDDVNGRFEFNQLTQWTAPITKVTRELDLSTPARTDPYGMEFVRINLDGKVTTDSSSDNNTFMAAVETVLQPDGYYKLSRPSYTITGVPDPVGIFNTEFSPKRALLNNAGLIHSVLDKLDTEKIKLTTSEKNKDLVAGSVVEKDDIQIGGLASKLFLPYYFTFKTQVPINLLETMNLNPYGQVEFVWNGLKWYGYLMDGGIKPESMDVQQWKLLAAPNQDLSKFNA